jgi:hypothetical protein
MGTITIGYSTASHEDASWIDIEQPGHFVGRRVRIFDDGVGLSNEGMPTIEQPRKGPGEIALGAQDRRHAMYGHDEADRWILRPFGPNPRQRHVTEHGEGVKEQTLIRRDRRRSVEI